MAQKLLEVERLARGACPAGGGMTLVLVKPLEQLLLVAKVGLPGSSDTSGTAQTG